MPREIADSDDELDSIPPDKLTSADIIEHVVTTGDTWNEDQLDPILGTDFDQFLSPTQRLSSYDGNHESANDIDTSKLLDSSTNRFLEAVAPSSNPPSQNKAYTPTASQSTDQEMGGKQSRDKATTTRNLDNKRPRSRLEDGDIVAQEEQGKKKRVKVTYGAASSSTTKSKDVSDFEAMMHDSRDDEAAGRRSDENLTDAAIAHPPEMVSVDARSNYTSPLDLSLHLSPNNCAPGMDDQTPDTESILAGGGYLPPQPYQARGHFYGADLRGVTASNSSMGNYQSFSINPEKLDVDFDKINPFGSLSQISLSGDLDSEETRGIADIFRNGASYRPKASTNNVETNIKLVPNVESDMQTSPIRGENEFNLRSRDQPPREIEAQCSPPFSQITNADEQNVDHGRHTSRRRSGQELAVTIDEAIAKPAPKKRGRKPKNAKKTDTPEPELEDVDELQVDEPLLDRGRRADTVDSISNISDILQTTNTSQRGKKRKLKKFNMAPPNLQSKKLPSSDLGLDNKAVIGLSPERYVPRPSRRRGHVEPHTSEPNVANNSVADLEDDPTDGVPTPASHGKGKKGKKGREKGLKAVDSAVTKQQEDLVAVDTKTDAGELLDLEKSSANATSQTHLDVNEDEAVAGEEDEGNDEVVIQGSRRRTKISVDIPVLARPVVNENLPPPVAEPKKRGRKRKKVLKETIVDLSEDERTRTALSEKDANIQTEEPGSEKFLKDNDVLVENQEKKSSSQDEEPEELDETEDHEQPPVPGPKDTSAATTMTTTPLKPLPTPTSTVKPLASTPLFNARARIGLSKRHSIPSLLRKVDRNKEAPKAIERKEKVTKRVLEEREQERIAREEAEAEGREFKPLDQLRDRDGRLVEWDF